MSQKIVRATTRLTEENTEFLRSDAKRNFRSLNSHLNFLINKMREDYEKQNASESC